MAQVDLPSVAVLLATHNGAEWLDQQVASITAQVGVNVHIVWSDYKSQDSTRSILEALPESLASEAPGCTSPGAAANFFHLMRSSMDRLEAFDYFAFADQDDVWFADKLVTALAALENSGSGGVSGNVLAAWPDGTTKIVVKDGRQRKYDHIFGSPGPGCTFVVTGELMSQLAQAMHHPDVDKIEYHDWAIYAFAREMGHKWEICGTPSMIYRQHDNNYLGASRGVASKLFRMGQVLNGWFISQAMLIANLGCRAADPFLEDVLMEPARFRHVFELRRSRAESLIAFVSLRVHIANSRRRPK